MHPIDVTTSIDVDRPSQARIYDYLLGGSLNFAADREAARHLIAMVPDVPLVAQANRAFLRRAIKFLVDVEVRQFLDIGSGVPTRGNVHEIVQRVAPESRVVYVDVDPVAVAHSLHILAGDERTTAVHADARHPELILGHPDVRRLLDLDAPVAVLMVSVLHFIADSDDPAGILNTLRDRLAAGSYLVVSHVTSDTRSGNMPLRMPLRPQDNGFNDRGTQDNRWSDTFAKPRTIAEVERFFTGFELVRPGVVAVQRWRPESLGEIQGNESLSCMHAGVGRKDNS
jgi:S-adenosyl methyltransferase